jgi:type IV pilus assembly protein PilC
MIWVVPQLEIFLKSLDQELPTSTKALIFLAEHSVLGCQILAGIIFLVFGVSLGMRRLSNRWGLLFDRLVLIIPLMGPLLKKIALQRFLQIFVSLLERGILLIPSLEIAMKNVSNLFLQDGLMCLRDEILKGVNFSKAWLTSSLSEPLIGRLASTGENTGQLETALRHAMSFLQRDIERLSQKLISLLEPVLLFLIGGIMIWVTSAIFLPLYDQLMSLE